MKKFIATILVLLATGYPALAAKITWSVITSPAKTGTFTVLVEGQPIANSAKFTLQSGSSISIQNIIPKAGYNLNSVKKDGKVVDKANLIFIADKKSHKVVLNFKKNPIITSSASPTAGGMITPSGKVLVAYGTKQVFTVSPKPGYDVKSFKIDNKSAQLANNAYTFNNVVSAHSISVIFAIKAFTIVSSVTGGNGTISPEGIKIVNFVTSLIYTATPNKGYNAVIYVDGIESVIGKNSLPLKFTISNITSNHNIEAKYFQVVNATGVSLNKETLPLSKGTSETLIATIIPSNAYNKVVTWKSSEPAVANVDSNGKVTAIKAGTSTITATTEDGGFRDTCVVTVAGETTYSDTLMSGNGLNVGDSIRSTNGLVVLNMQSDGNLVLYHVLGSKWVPKWASHTTNNPGACCKMQSDGNLVIYNSNMIPLWASWTVGSANSRLVVQNDGNLVIYNASNSAAWATMTYYPSLGPNQGLNPGQQITSRSGKVVLAMQTDGNLVLYHIMGSSWVAKWDSKTNGNPGTYCIMQNDGNFVVYNSNGKALWASWTNNISNASLEVQDDGNMVIYDLDRQAKWNTNTFIDIEGSQLAKEAINRAHADLGSNPLADTLICLKYVRTWSGIGSKHYSAEVARQNYLNKGVFHVGGNPLDAPLGAWLFYSWNSVGHVGIRCEHGLIHQNNFKGGNGIISHDDDAQLSIPYLGYVTIEDAHNHW